jgi:hypothetical protein
MCTSNTRLTACYVGAACTQHHSGSLFTYFFASGTPPCGSAADCPAEVATQALTTLSDAMELQFAAEAVEGIALPVLGPEATASLTATTHLCAKFAAAANYAMREAGIWGFRPAPTAPTRGNPNAAAGTNAGEIVETVEVQEGEGQSEAGRFTAFADGSVHVAFVDRTMISLHSLDDTRPGHDRAEVLLPDGSRRSIPLHAAPTGGLLGDTKEGRIGRHLAAAARFQEWACLTPAERMDAAMRDQARKLAIQAELAKTQRFLSMQDMHREPVGRSIQLGQQRSPHTHGVDGSSGHGATVGVGEENFEQELRSRMRQDGLDLSGLLARNRETIADIHKLVSQSSATRHRVGQ